MSSSKISRRLTLIECLVVVLILGIVTFWLFRAVAGIFVDERKATDAARISGYQSAVVTDKAVYFVSWRGCSRGDDARFTVHATNSQGEQVDFYVCVALFFKGSTIRTK